MAKVEATVTSEDIQKVVREIVECFRPQKVVLFGSYARGTPSRDSDVDLLVVMDTEDQPLHVTAGISAAIDHPFPLDIIVSTPSKLEESLARKGVFAAEVITEGVVLYEARDTVVD